MHVQARFLTSQASLTCFDFVYTGPVLNPADQLIIWWNVLLSTWKREVVYADRASTIHSNCVHTQHVLLTTVDDW